MAKYVYRCAVCKQEQNVEHRMTDDPQVTCSCGANCTRVPQPVGTVLKGKGFYRNDKNFDGKEQQ